MIGYTEESSLVGKDLYKSWGEVVGIKNVSISIKRGQITTLLGPSGSGKTTLIRTLSMLDTPDSGSISVDGLKYNYPSNNHNNPKPPWPKVTVVFQQLFLWPHLRLKDNILLPLRNKEIYSTKKELDKIIKLFGMEDFINRYPNEASLGQRQRVALVRALALRPSYILLDEITSALDFENVTAILKQLELLREEGIGVFMVTHLIGFARRAADNVIFLDKGEVLESGDNSIFKSPKNQRVKRFLNILDQAT